MKTREMVIALGMIILLACQSITTIIDSDEDSAVVATPNQLSSTSDDSPATTELPTDLGIMESTEIVDDKGVTMLIVPEGEFNMGMDADDGLMECLNESSNRDCRHLYGDEYPPHQVFLDAFYMDKYEVTNILYKSCVNTGICTEPGESRPGDSTFYNDASYANHPVSHVDWFQAMAYCKWRGATLPTEAQWEKAARGTDSRTYPWGEGIGCDKANYFDPTLSDSCLVAITKVGEYDDGVSPYGIYDMAGNIQEWVADWYSASYYQNSPPSNPVGPASGAFRVVRGGGWNSIYSDLSSTTREFIAPASSFGKIGFRCARNTPVENSP